MQNLALVTFFFVFLLIPVDSPSPPCCCSLAARSQVALNLNSTHKRSGEKWLQLAPHLPSPPLPATLFSSEMLQQIEIEIVKKKIKFQVAHEALQRGVATATQELFA